jgi:hypothetical protein
VLVALGVGAYFLFSGGSASASTPKDAAKALFEAGKTGDVAAARKALCAADNRAGIVSDLDKSGRIKSYSIDKVQQKNDTSATVTVTFTSTDNPSPQTVPFPVVKEDGKWKVCITKLTGGGGLVPGPSSGPPSGLPSISIPPISGLPSITGIPNGTNPCSYISDPETVALAYVGAAEIGQTDVAQACVYQDSVPRSLTASLKASGSALFAPSGSSGNTYRFASLDGNTQLAVSAASGTVAAGAGPFNRPWRSASAITTASTTSETAPPRSHGTLALPPRRAAASPPTPRAPSRAAVIRVSQLTRCAVAVSAPCTRRDITGAAMSSAASSVRPAPSCIAIASGSGSRRRCRSMFMSTLSLAGRPGVVLSSTGVCR